MLSHANFMANSMMHVANLGLHEAAVHLHVSPMFHVAGGARLFSVTVAGATHAVLEAFEPDAFLAAIERFKVTVTVVVPTVLNRLVDHPDLSRYDLSSLQLLVLWRVADARSAAEARDAAPAGHRVPAVVRHDRTLARRDDADAALSHVRRPGRRLHALGRAGRFQCRCRDLRSQTTGRCRPAAIGEICVRGPMVMQGYWRQPELTAEALRNGWMHTGDAGYIDARGFVFLVDRVKDMIVTGGENVYSAEVENVIYQHPAVHECAVIGVPSDAWGEAVHAIVVTKPGPTSRADETHRVLPRSASRTTKHRSRAKCARAELPKSGAGKILKADLRKPFWTNTTRGIN